MKRHALFLLLLILSCGPLFGAGQGETGRPDQSPARPGIQNEQPPFPEGLSDQSAGERSCERAEERQAMVRSQLYDRGITDREVLGAMSNVPRHLFVPEQERRRAYADTPLPIGYGQTISQPYVVALMTWLLDISPGDRILEVGTGSGYQAAVLAELTDQVYSIEIIEALAEGARNSLASAGYTHVKVRRGDGYYGWPDAAPFQGIIITAAAGHVPPPLIEQLAPGGRIIVPLGNPYQIQILTIVEKDAEGRVRSEQLMPVRFVPMTGKIGGPES
ncbi:MAG: protein-L-isoaspartate(D-aspartate) O-methyltransferase [Spirochaetota bacterium]|nr:protein-L-isoaspartate(D-aspartate) O-methyltransferase [Spirochaetota bacterium]